MVPLYEHASSPILTRHIRDDRIAAAPVLAFKPVDSITLFLNVLHQFGEPGRVNASLAVRWVRRNIAPFMVAARSVKTTRSKTKGTSIAARSFQSSENSMEIGGEGGAEHPLVHGGINHASDLPLGG